MPIYAYRCTGCGHAKDVLQRMSDPLLTVCPECGESTFVKQVTAAGFQLKGSGWYVTDFKGGAAAPKPADGAPSEAAKNGDAAKPDAAPAAAAAPSGATSAAAPAAAAPAPAASTPAGK